MLVLLLLFLSNFSRRRCEDLTFIYFRLVFYYIFNYEIVKMINSNKRLLLNLHLEVLCHYWTIEEFQSGFQTVLNLFRVNIYFYSTIFINRIILRLCNSNVYLEFFCTFVRLPTILCEEKV